jgi:small subunit ribosomal protein S19
MAKKKIPKRKAEFTYRGYKMAELKKMDIEQMAELFPARVRRKLKRGLTDEEKLFLRKIHEDKPIRTHLRGMIVLPEMVGLNIGIHDGQNFVRVDVQPEMLGHYLGEFAMTRKKIAHGSAGIGATKSSKYIPLK